MKSEEFREYLKILGWTKERAAKELGIARKTVDNWAHGRTRIPKAIDRLMPYLVKETKAKRP